MDMIYFGGCSITMGAGFEQSQQDPRIYPNLVKGRNQSINDAEGGSSNLKIFTKAAKAIVDDLADIYVIQWSAVHRHWVYPMPNQGIYIGSAIENNRYQDFVRQYQSLNHDYPNLMAVIDYSRILHALAESRHMMIIFVNGMLSWKQDWTDPYMQGLLEGLAQKEKQDFIERFKNNLELMDRDNWTNIYESIAEMQIDDAPLDHHPGPKTHEKIAAMIDKTIDKLRDE